MTSFTVRARTIFFPPSPDLQTLCKGSVPSTQPLQGVEQSQACSAAQLLRSWCHGFRCNMLCSHWFVSPLVHTQQILCGCLLCFKNRVHKPGMWFFFFLYYNYVNGSRCFLQGWVMLFLYDRLLWIKCSSVSSRPAAHRCFAFKTLLMLHHSYGKWKSLELQAAGRAQCGASRSRLFATNYYTWASKSSLIPFFLFFKPFKTQWGLRSTPFLILKY